MKLSTKQIIILWFTVLFVIIFLGLTSIEAYGHKDLVFYGITLLTTAYKGSLVHLGDYKYQLIVATLLIGTALIITLREK